MNNELLIIVFFLIFGLSIIGYILFKKIDSVSKKEDDKSVLMLQQQLSQLQQQLQSGLAESNKVIHASFRASNDIVKDVTEKLTKIDETNKQVMGFAEQLQSLENVLKNPKQRGILGEYYLETLLKNIFNPNQYEMQYKFKNGDIVDAVVKLGGGKIIPIDSKFSLENYNKIVEEKDTLTREKLQKDFKQDLKNRIDETAKYIKPNEGTMDFAFMFIPSEGIYYDLLVNQVGALKVNTRDLIEYAFKERRVIIVSPTSFAAYLQTVLQGLRSLKIEESVNDVIKNVGNLGKHLDSYQSYFDKVGNNLSTTVTAYNNASKEFKKIDKDVAKISGKKESVELASIDKPQIE